MNKHLILALLCVLPYLSIAQSNTSIDLVVGGDLGYRFTQIDPEDPTAESIQAILDDRVIMKPNGRIGLNINRKLTQTFYIRLGVQYANPGIRTRKDDLILPDQIDSSGTFIPNDPLNEVAQAKWSYHFIQVPLVGRLELRKGKLVPFVEAGVLPSFYLFTRYELSTEQQVLSSRQDQEDPGIYNYFQLAGLVSAGVNYQVTEKLQLFGQPIFRLHFTPQASEALVIQRLYGVGVEAGIRVGL